MGKLSYMTLYTIRLFNFFLYPVLDCLTSTVNKPGVCGAIPSSISYSFRELKTSYCRNMADCGETRKLNPRVSRIVGVEGDAGKTNDVLMCAGRKPEYNHHVVYFGGDVQDYIENMEFHRDNRRYMQWNLEATAEILQEKFPGSHIWVVKPANMQFKTFSIYSNFVTSDDTGCPHHSSGQASWTHLAKLLKSASIKAQEAGLPKSGSFNEDYSVNLVGFSKGCVVLNQLLYDLGDAKEAGEDTSLFVKSVEKMHWLDGGHAGGSNTYVTDTSVLSSLLGTGIKIKCLVTPYQVKDSMRKWIGKEHKKFISNLKELGASVENTMLFEEQERSIENHFEVLIKFNP